MRHHFSRRKHVSAFHQLNLSDLHTGTSGIVHSLGNGKDLTARLASLGITPGVQFSVLQNYGHGPVIIIVRDTRIALGRGEARKVLVEKI